MTRIEERLRALSAARAWMTDLLLLPTSDPLYYQADWYLGDYPADASLHKRLVDLEGYGLLLAVRRIERVRALIDEVRDGAASNPSWQRHQQAVRYLTRHFPEPHELAPAIRTPQAARAWAAFYLDRPPGRLRVLTPGEPNEERWTRLQRRRRQEALRCLPAGLRRLDRDPLLPPLGVAEVRQVLLQLPSKSELGSRLMGVRLGRFNEALACLQRACQLLEAVVEGTFPAGLRQQALAQRLSSALPHSEAFPLSDVGDEGRQAWGLWLFASAQPNRNGSDISSDPWINRQGEPS